MLESNPTTRTPTRPTSASNWRSFVVASELENRLPEAPKTGEHYDVPVVGGLEVQGEMNLIQVRRRHLVRVEAGRGSIALSRPLHGTEQGQIADMYRNSKVRLRGVGRPCQLQVVKVVSGDEHQTGCPLQLQRFEGRRLHARQLHRLHLTELFGGVRFVRYQDLSLRIQ
jgi:hypothetical protein